MSDSFLHTFTAMGTVVTIQVVGHGANDEQRQQRSEAVERAVGWFRAINDSCTRFDPESELSRLTRRVGTPTIVSAPLYEALRFALAVAEETDGAFDPTVGHRMETRGFNQNFQTGQIVDTPGVSDQAVSYRDVHVDRYEPSVTLLRPLMLDLGAIVKGLAVDMAAHELQPFTNFAIDAGGDLYLGGCNGEGAPWSIGIRHPRNPGELLATLRISNGAVCTSGDYERPSPSQAGEHHIVDPRSGDSARQLASVTVLAPSTMVADALATAAFVLGPEAGLALFERHGVEGLLVTPTLERFPTPGMPLG